MSRETWSLEAPVGLAVAILFAACGGGTPKPVVPSASGALHDPLLDNMIGSWILEGTIGGAQTEQVVKVKWELGGEYIKLHEVSREKDTAGRPVYEAIVYIGKDPAADGYACLWLDSTGGGGLSGQALGHAPRAEKDLAFVFDDGKGGRFHTTFAYDNGTDSWTWAMDSEEGGALKPFARVTLTRKK